MIGFENERENPKNSLDDNMRGQELGFCLQEEKLMNGGRQRVCSKYRSPADLGQPVRARTEELKERSEIKGQQ